MNEQMNTFSLTA